MKKLSHPLVIGAISGAVVFGAAMAIDSGGIDVLGDGPQAAQAGGNRGYSTGYDDARIHKYELDKWSPGISATIWCPVAYRNSEFRFGTCFLYDKKHQVWVGEVAPPK